MSIKPHPGKPPPMPPCDPSWGELAEPDQTSEVVRLALAGRIVSVPFNQFRFWELTAGEPESLTLHTEELIIAIQGRNLNAIALALDLRRVIEVRTNREFQSDRAGPQVREITITEA